MDYRGVCPCVCVCVCVCVSSFSSLRVSGVCYSYLATPLRKLWQQTPCRDSAICHKWEAPGTALEQGLECSAKSPHRSKGGLHLTWSSRTWALTTSTDVRTASETLCRSSAAVPGLLSPRVNFLASGAAEEAMAPSTCHRSPALRGMSGVRKVRTGAALSGHGACSLTLISALFAGDTRRLRPRPTAAGEEHPEPASPRPVRGAALRNGHAPILPCNNAPWERTGNQLPHHEETEHTEKPVLFYTTTLDCFWNVAVTGLWFHCYAYARLLCVCSVAMRMLGTKKSQ